MNKNTIVWIIIGWIILMFLNYYYMPYFLLILELFGLLLFFLTLAVIQFIMLIKERNAIKKSRIQKLLVYTFIFLLILYNQRINILIERLDWHLFYNKRMEIVETVKNIKTSQDTLKSYLVYKLPFKFPVISNGGNDIVICRNEICGTITVTFWVFRNFFSSPSTHLIYTNDKEEMKRIENLINKHPNNNWKIEDHWYRTYEE